MKKKESICFLRFFWAVILLWKILLIQICARTSSNENRTLFTTVFLIFYIIMIEHMKAIDPQNFRLNRLFL